MGGVHINQPTGESRLRQRTRHDRWVVDERGNVGKEEGGVWLLTCGCMDTCMDSIHFRLLLLYTFFKSYIDTKLTGKLDR